MFRRIKWEIDWIRDHIAVIVLGAFLCAMGGIVLWVNGGSSWYILFGKKEHSLTFLFLVWLFAYALCGIRLAIRWERNGCSGPEGKRIFVSFLLTALAYLFDLIWYALFFCTRLTAFALVILFISVLVNISVIVCARRGMVLTTLLDITVIMIEIGFICYGIYFLLLN